MPECTGGSESGGVCGDCNSRWQRDCSNGQWGGWYCQNNAPSNFNADCNCNACGQCGGKVGCWGCTAPTPPLVSWYGQPCNCNLCGQCGGTITCSGGCSGSTPALPSGYGDKCGNGGTILCNGDCSKPCEPNYGDKCGNGGTILCDGITCEGEDNSPVDCSPTGPPQSQPCDNCGTQTRTCQSNYQWGTWGECTGQGVCNPTGPPQSQPCGNGGTKTRTCTSGCNWGLWGPCTGEDTTIVDTPPETPCTGSATGTVKDQGSQPISSANVILKRDLTTIDSAATNSQGIYSINSISCGAYSLTASHSSYVSQVKNVNIASQQQAEVNFNLVSGSICETDCTYTGDNTVHKDCDKINGCSFYDSTAANACNLAQPGWIRDYSPTHQIQCAEGAPYAKIQTKAKVTCKKENLIETTHIVNYQGKLVKMIVVTCG
ncbi:carboxypeptidase regulatory-like domain-containing protein [Candidatus Woesearchaeota archaeon]|nr:carboxypeptidase regulatory-like domain-containing protein [Candidatus Woesearchaeota archaeon]